MVNKRSMGGMVAVLTFFFAVPALASAHTLAVSAGPSHCVTPLNGQYTATVTITENYFGGTTEDIPVGQNVYEVLASSTDKGNTGVNHNYFTQGAIGTQTGPISFGQPTLFTSPASGGAATQTFTVTTSVPETYVLGNSYMSSPSSTTITAPATGCSPPPPPTCASGDTLVNGICVPPTSCPSGDTLSGGVCVPPASCPSGDTLTNGTCLPPTSCPSGDSLVNGTCVPPTKCPSGYTLTGGQCVPPSGCPAGEVASGGQCVPPTNCPSGDTLSGGQCVPPTTCPSGDTLTGSGCVPPTIVPPPTVYPAVCRASSKGYKVRAGQEDTIVVSVDREGTPVAGAGVHITLPGGKVITKSTGTNGKATFTVEPTKSGTIVVRSPSCNEMAKVKVYAAKAATAQRAPSFTG
ncbi:MAG TPA: hypothetical protein VMF57_09165 [Solirubrobacteraceae bacterium]|nr:hypothetical protein [Solirubrobacteraceae bacterium]